MPEWMCLVIGMVLGMATGLAGMDAVIGVSGVLILIVLVETIAFWLRRWQGY